MLTRPILRQFTAVRVPFEAQKIEKLERRILTMPGPPARDENTAFADF